MQKWLTACSDLGRIKYLKDADDFDLDPEQIVSDVFVNEGKADRDGLDQEATIKVIQEQGQAVRQGSVVPDLTPVQYQKRPLPPVPRFSEIPQTLGKRSHEFANGRNISGYRYGSKRFRQEEIDETQDEDDLIPSVERSPELIADTQTSQGQARGVNVKLESPELLRSYHDIVPANEDELELLPEAPPNFPNNRRNYVLGGEHLTPKMNGLVKNAAGRSSAAGRDSQLPITPPTDPAVAGAATRGSAVNGRGHDSRSPALGASSTISKFKSARRNLYEQPESDIEDSQMSPRAMDALPVPRLVKKMSSVENPPSQQHISYDTFNARSALDPMDLDEEANTTEAFIAEKRHSVSMHNDFGDRAMKAAQARREASDEEVEISATASDHKQGESGRTAGKPSERSKSDVRNAQPSKSPDAKKTASSSKESESRPTTARSDSSKSAAAGGATSTPKKIKTKKPRGQRKRAAQDREQAARDKSVSEYTGQNDESTRRESTGASSNNKTSTSTSRRGSVFDASKVRRRSSLDSPGEQLSQALQASARKPSLAEVNSKLAPSEKKDESRPSTSGSGSANADASTSSPSSRRTSSSSSKSESSARRLGLGITNSPRKKKDEDAGKKQEAAPKSTLVEKLKKAKEDAKSTEQQHEPSKPGKDTTSTEKETVVPSVEKTGKKGGRPLKEARDLDAQCCVLLTEDKRCGRALDCKLHKFQQKRAVAGRSQPFDALLNAFKAAKPAKNKDKQSTPSLPLPNWGSEETPSATGKASAPTKEAPSTESKPSTSKVLPRGMTQQEYDCMMKANESKPIEERPKKKKKAAKENPKPAPPPPEIEVSEESDGESKSADEKPNQEEAAKGTPKAAPPPPEIKVSEESDEDSTSGSESEESESEDSSSESEEKPEPVKKSKVQAPAEKKPTKAETKTKTPNAHLMRESTTPGSDFDEIGSRLKSIKYPSSSDNGKLQPVPPTSTLKKKGSSASDRRSSGASSEAPTSETKKVTPKPTPSIASSSAGKPIKPASASAKADKPTEKATPQSAKTPKPKPAAMAGSSTSSIKQKEKVTPNPANNAPPISGLQKLKAELQAKSREASATPAKGMSLSNQGAKKVFNDDSDESSSESESSSSESDESENEGKKAKSKLDQGKSKGKSGKGGGSAVTAKPDRSIRDVTPDDSDSSDED